MSKEMEIKQECCNIWNNLKDKTQMIDCLIESKQQIFDLEAKLALTEKALELACLAISKAMCPNGNWETLKIDFTNAYKEQAKEMMKSE